MLPSRDLTLVMGLFLSLAFSACGLIQNLTGKDKPEPMKIEFPIGSYSCKSNHESLFIEKSSDNYLFQYYGGGSSDPYYVADSVQGKTAASKFTAVGDSLFIQSSHINFKGKYISASDLNAEKIAINGLDSVFEKSFEVKSDSPGSYRLRDFICHGIAGLAGCDGYWIYCKKEFQP